MFVCTFIGLWGFFVATYLFVRITTMSDDEYFLFKE